MATWPVGQRIRSTAVFRDIDNDLVTPTTVIMKQTDPSGNTTWYSAGSAGMTNPGTGTYYVEWTLDEHGAWRRRWETGGNLEVSHETLIWVRDSQFD